MEKNLNKPTKLGSKIWFNILFFGFIGSIAWMLENMYFATFAQDLLDKSNMFGDLYYTATTLMVIFSAIFATLATIFAGGLCDRLGKRKPILAVSYIIWGFTILLFLAIPIDFDKSQAAGVVAMLVIFDCIMSFVGSCGNDAAYNCWVTDITDVSNRGKVDNVLSMFPVLSTVLVVVIAMFTYDKGSEDPFMYKLFFIIIGILPIIAGILAFFILHDKPGIQKSQNPNYIKDTLYGFSGKVIKENKMIYITMSVYAIIGISQQVYMSYLINFVQKTLEIDNYIVPLAAVIILSSVITVIIGVLFDKFGRKHFYFPLLASIFICTLIVYLMKFADKSAYMPMIIVFGTLMLSSTMCMFGALMASFQDYIPKGYEGRFQGIRMTFIVLIPMIIGPLVSLAIGITGNNTEAITTPPFEIFLAAAIISIFAIIPLIFVYKDSNNLRSRLMEEKQQLQDNQ